MKNTAVISLARNTGERSGYLTCWYNLYIPGFKKVQFRSEGFVPEDIEERLQDLHCVPHTIAGLTHSCVEILNPYAEKIITEAKKFLKDPLNPEYHDTFIFANQKDGD